MNIYEKRKSGIILPIGTFVENYKNQSIIYVTSIKWIIVFEKRQIISFHITLSKSKTLATLTIEKMMCVTLLLHPLLK